MTYVKTTANERRQQVKLRYVHLSPKGSTPAKGILKTIVAWFTPSKPANTGLGQSPEYKDPYRVPGAFGGGQKPAGTKLVKMFAKNLQPPRGY
jgi:hypothetical protein